MEYRRLGDAGMKVSLLALGGWINFEAKIDQDEAKTIIKTAYDGGVNFYDVADVYGFGEAERWMGGLLADFPRHTLVISTKVFGEMSDDVNDRGLSRKHIVESIDKSLQRLGTDYVDIYFCHRADPETSILETARAMNDLIRQGKVLYWGTSEWSAEQLQAACDLCDAHHLDRPKAEQPGYSMIRRTRVEGEILSVTEEKGIGVTIFSPLAYGVLTGKYDGGIPDDSRLAREDWSQGIYDSEENLQKVRDLKTVADDLGATRAQLALAWTLRLPAISSAITGATTLRQMEDNLGALDLLPRLTPDVLARIDAILA